MDSPMSSNSVDEKRRRRGSSSSSYSRNSSRNSGKDRRSRRHSSSRSNSHHHTQQHDLDADKKQNKTPFEYELYLKQDQVEILYQKTNDNFDYMCERSGVQKMYYDGSIHIPDMPGKLLKIKDESYSNKYSCTSTIFRTIIEGMVSLLIGKQGRQINKIMDDSKTKIVANQPITGMNQRTIAIEGAYGDVAKAIEIIYDIMSERAEIVTEIEKVPRSIQVDQIIVKSRIVISYNLKNYLLGYRGRNGKNFIQHIDNIMGTRTFFGQERQPYLLRDDVVCTIKGKLEPVQKTICGLFRKFNEYYVQERSKPDYKIKILIPQNYVTKLIGKEGCMIRDIAARSGGAQIKIISDKGSDRNYYECPIDVAGTLGNKQDAVCLILEKIEQFKNGGPILKTAKAINDNLVEQYRNSIQDNCVQHDQRFKADLRLLEDEFDRSRSREREPRYGERNERERERGARKYSHTDKRMGAYDDPYYRAPASRSRSRSRDYKKDYHGSRYERDMKLMDRDRMMRDNGRRGYESNRGDRYYEERYIEDKYKNERMRRPESPKHRSRRGDSNEKEIPLPQKLKIPIILTSKLVAAFQENDYKILKNICDTTGCKISIEKEKRLLLYGTVESNTNAFKKIQKEFLKLGNEL